jgi:DNA-binding ferritin-like protein
MKIGDYIMALFNARTAAHVMHLQVTGPGSYAAHKALSGFYEGIVDLADDLAEAYQGCYGLIKFPTGYVRPVGEAIPMLEDLKEKTMEMREEFDDEPHLQNIIDGVTALIDSTMYKLKYLK